MNMRCGIRIGVQEITQNRITKEGLCLLADILTEIIQTQKITSETRMKREQLLNIGFRKHEEGASFIELFNMLNTEK